MAASSSHYGDIHRWILKVIDSCNQNNQIFTAHRLVDNFCSMEKPTLTWHERTILHTELIHAVHEKQRQLLEKQYESTRS